MIALPRGLRALFKRGRILRSRLRTWRGRLLLFFGRPVEFSRYLRERDLKARVVLAKQGTLSVSAGATFLRYAEREKAVARLRDEMAWRNRLLEAGLGDFVVPTMTLHELEHGVVLESPALTGMTADEQLKMTIPVVRGLAGAAVPSSKGGVPETVARSLDELRGLEDIGEAPRVLLRAVEEAFRQPLLRGISHQDLHLRNVMKDPDGRSILIDLKSCIDDQVLDLDLLNFICKYLGYRTRANVIDTALDEHARGWNRPEFEPVFELLTLPRELWGAVYCLHACGRVLLRSHSDPVMRRILRRVVEASSRSAD